uniref:BED-type domain-containing protein n=1 Tax=Fundulus heteroclitus TaxID=8078 RepID=A0A3Q2PK85_FUNHE
MQGEEKCAFSSWKYSHYFKFMSSKDDIKVRCTLCGGDKVLSSLKNTTSNLKKHLTSQHSAVKLSGFDCRWFQAKSRDCRRAPASQTTKAGFPYSYHYQCRAAPQNILFILPREGVYRDGEKSKSCAENVPFVSTTADIWSVNNISYLGLTVHWISESTLERNKAALACWKICGRHTYDVIGAEMENIHSSYGLLNKVVATVTDNRSNFVKAFQVYQPAEESQDDEEDTGEEDDGQLCLPPHHRCASHTINIISTNYVEKYLTSNAESKALYRSSIAKCTAFWTKSSRSTLASETVEEVSKIKLLVPTSTRWNSFFDAVNRIIEMPMSELDMLCTKLGVKCFKYKEYQFLHEYCSFMKLMTAALDIVQGDCPYGTLLPTLEVLMQKTLAVKDTLSRMTAGLPDAIVKAIHNRFAGVLDDKDALLAAASCPKFKLRWLRDAGRKDLVKVLVTAECRATAPAAQSPPSVATTSGSQGEMDFFSFEVEPKDDTYSAENKVMDYLRSAYDLQIFAPFQLSDKTFEKLLLMRYNHWFNRTTPLFHF